MLDTLALWLATYALHSTLLLLSAWWLARVFPAARERLWRLALFGGLLTAAIDAGGVLAAIHLSRSCRGSRRRSARQCCRQRLTTRSQPAPA